VGLGVFVVAAGAGALVTALGTTPALADTLRTQFKLGTVSISTE